MDTICDLKNPFEEYHMPVLRLLVKGKTANEISTILDRPFETVISQVKRMQTLAGTHKTAELTYFAGLYRWV
ncbi:MAG: helix-turn-helix transcriptional regulator [Bacteroidia bacterium]